MRARIETGDADFCLCLGCWLFLRNLFLGSFFFFFGFVIVLVFSCFTHHYPAGSGSPFFPVITLLFCSYSCCPLLLFSGQHTTHLRFLWFLVLFPFLCISLFFFSLLSFHLFGYNIWQAGQQHIQIIS